MNTPETRSKALTPQTGGTTPLLPARHGRRPAAPPERPVRQPATGELLDLAVADDIELASRRLEALHLQRQLDEFKALIDGELLERMDRDNTHSMRAGMFEIKESTSATVVTWDTAELSIVLTALIESGRLSQAAARKALETRVEYKAKAAKLNQLLRHPDIEVRDAIAACRSERPNTARRVSVTTTHPTNHPSTK